MQVNRHNSLSGMSGAPAGIFSYSAGISAQKTAAKTVKKTSNKTKKKKSVPYRLKELSNAILNSKDSGSARRALIRANSKAMFLRGKQTGGEYDTWELLHAILHAEAMVRVARKRMKHFQMEEEAKRRQGGSALDDPAQEALERSEPAQLMSQDAQESEAQDDLAAEEQKIAREMAQKLSREMQRLIEEAMREAMEEAMRETMSAALDEALQDVVGGTGKMRPEELEQLKKKHRSEELREIMEADMKYLRALFNKLAQEKQSGANSLSGIAGNQSADIGAVSLELGGADVPVEVAVPVDAAAGGSVDIAI